MKSKKTMLMALILCAALICSLSVSASAKDVPDIGRRCSLTIHMKYGNTVLKGGSLSIYRVGRIAENNGDYSFAPTDAFAASGENFQDLKTNAETARRLESYVTKAGIAPLASKTIGNNGQAVFSDLDTGLYLVIQDKATPGYEVIDPFLVSLPYLENGAYRYDLTAEPKTEPPQPTETEPSETTTPDIPQTGQLWWPVPMLAFAGLLFVTGGVMMTRGKHEE